jgi:cytochrome c oxidase subunit 2
MLGKLPRARRALVAVAGAAVSFVLAATSASAAQPWIFDPASGQARQLGQLFWLTLVLAAVVFVLVEALLLYSSLRFRRRAPIPTHEPPQIHGNTRLEIMWAIVPALILIGLFGVSVRTLNALGSFPDNGLVIKVEAFQFGWTFRYPDSEVQTTNELRIPANSPVIFEVTSRDVIHSFWVPDLHGKIDANPGKVNRIWMQADRPGTFRGVCAELCGAGHAGMLFRVEAMPQEEFQQWFQDQKAGAAERAAAGPSLERGKEVFQTKGCGSCHTLAAVPGAAGAVGPNLNNIGSAAEQRKPGTSAEAYIRESIQDPSAFIAPGFPPLMPQLPMTEDELTSLVTLLQAQK